jgi:ATP citrate (pro-S)-lyase
MHTDTASVIPPLLQGLAAMKAMGADLGLPVEVYGPESSMTGICAQAITYVQGFDR